MTHGGKRSGAGRKAGVPNKVTAEVRAAIAETGETPRDYMLRVMRDETVDHARRDGYGQGCCAVLSSAFGIGCHERRDSGRLQHV